MPSHKRLYRKIFDEISTLIDLGEYPVGSRLPTERQLAERFQVSRPTIREAIIALDATNKVSVKTGSGVYVLEKTAKDRFDYQEISPFEVIEARVLREFHSIIANATHNTIIAKQIHTLWELQENTEHIKEAHQSVCDSQDVKRIKEHKDIMQAIIEHDANAARTAMHKHFSNILEAMHSTLEEEALKAAKLKGALLRKRFSLGLYASVE